jgi:transposase, IS30 family
MWTQLTREQRFVLAQLLQLKLPKTEIAKRLDVHRSTVYAELKRNSGPVGYQPEEAQQRTDTRRWVNRRRKMNDREIGDYVRQRLEDHWSPDQIAGRSQLDFPRSPRRHVSRQTIYNWVDGEHRLGHRHWRDCLRFGRPRRKRPENAGRLPGAVSIEGRPQVVDLRRRYGDWEGDTIVGRNHRGGLVSLVERKSGYTLLRRVGDLCADTVREALEHRLAPLPDRLRRTATFDNGKEFAEHKRLAEAVGMNMYFAKPYSAWQRGTNENTNGLVRQYYPKGTDLAALSHREVTTVEAFLNDRPRKRLGYKTPREVLNQVTRRHDVAFEF